MISNDAAHRILRVFPLLLMMGMIFYLSDQPGDDLHLPDIYGLDKIAHFGEYILLAAAALYAVLPLDGKIPAGWLGAGVVAFCFFHAMADEFHQSFISGRDASGWDVLADVIGALLFVVAWGRKTLKKGSVTKN